MRPDRGFREAAPEEAVRGRSKAIHGLLNTVSKVKKRVFERMGESKVRLKADGHELVLKRSRRSSSLDIDTRVLEGLCLQAATPDEAREILGLKGADQVGF
jgi:hypothetical protein